MCSFQALIEKHSHEKYCELPYLYCNVLFMFSVQAFRDGHKPLSSALTEGIRIAFTVVGVYAKMGERVLTLSVGNSFKVRMQNDVRRKLHTQREFKETIT